MDRKEVRDSYVYEWVAARGEWMYGHLTLMQRNGHGWWGSVRVPVGGLGIVTVHTSWLAPVTDPG